MKSCVYLYHDKKTNSLLKLIFGFLTLFFILEIWKNCISLYNHGITDLYVILKPLILTIGSIIISFIFSFLYKEQYFSYRFLNNILISLITFCFTNVFIYFSILIGINLLYNKININLPALFMTILIVISLAMHNFTIFNELQILNEYSYDIMDYLLGRGYSAIATGPIILSIILFIILNINLEYKKTLPVISLIIYYLLICLLFVISHKISLDLLLNSDLIFALIFILPIPMCSPYTKGGIILSGIILAIIIFIFSFFNVYLGIYLGILLISIIHKYVDNIFVGNGKISKK